VIVRPTERRVAKLCWVNPNRRSRSVRETLGPYLATIISSIGHSRVAALLQHVFDLGPRFSLERADVTEFCLSGGA
jgi:hypothetical protein